MSGKLAGHVALVTGASRGIGAAIALELGRAGASLVLCSRTSEALVETVQRLEAEQVPVLALACDVSDASQVEALVEAAQARFGRVNVLVNNAGIVVRKRLAEMEDADFTDVIDVNLVGPFLLIRRLAPGMVARGEGRIINVGSISGTLGSPRQSGYCASKWGLNGLTQSLAEELKGSGVSVTAVLPGSVDTDMLKGSGYAPEVTPEEIAGTVRWLASEAPLTMTGALVEVFG